MNQFFLKQHITVILDCVVKTLFTLNISQVLPWGSVCWPTAVPSRTRFPDLPLRRCAYVLPRWGCACRCARSSYPWTAPPRGSAARGWHRPSAPDGPRCDFAAERVTTARDENLRPLKAAEVHVNIQSHEKKKKKQLLCSYPKTDSSSCVTELQVSSETITTVTFYTSGGHTFEKTKSKCYKSNNRNA